MTSNRDYTPEFVKILNDIVRSYDRLTPTKIHHLRPSQIFVFGTDRQGSQKFGAAGLAAKSFGAQVGVSSGLTGNSYALPTKGISLGELKEHVVEFEKFAREHTELKFLVTAIGCGHAGWCHYPAYIIYDRLDKFLVFLLLFALKLSTVGFVFFGGHRLDGDNRIFNRLFNVFCFHRFCGIRFRF